jgi:hypothetical protein
MLALSDSQLAIVVTLAHALAPEKREVYLQRIAARLQCRSGQHTDDDVRLAAEQALASLIQTRNAA